MTAQTAAREESAGSRLGALAQFGLLAGPFLSMIDSSVVNVAVPAMARSFGAPLSQLQWVISGYLLALAAGLAVSAYLARRYGTRRVYLASLAGFAVASLACALAGSAGWLIAARILQGLLGAPMTPLAMGMMFGGDEAKRQLSATAGLALFLPPALGPAIGGFLVAHFGWQSIFLINLPVGLAAIVGVQRLPPSLAPARDREARIDPAGLALISAGLALTSYGAVNGPADGWLSARSWPFWLTGITLLGCYAAWSRRRQEPAVSLRLLSARGPALAIALSVVAAVVLFAALFLIPAYVEQVQGQSAAAAGLILLPQGLVMAAGTIAGDMLARRRLIKPAAVAGTMILAMSTGLLLLVQAATPGWLTALLLCGRGLALGLIIQPLLVATLSGLPPADLADANALFNIVDRVGGSFGVGLIASFFQASVLAHLRAIGPGLGSSALMTSRLDGTPAWRLLDAATAAFHDTVWLLVAVAGLAFALALLIPSRMGQTPAGPEPTAASRPLA